MSHLAPETLDEALEALAGAPLTPLAGGTDLFARAGPPPAGLLDLTRIAELRGISRGENGTWRIGAATTWAEIAGADLPPAFDALRQAAREVGAIQIQNAGTIGGNLCNASPAADGVPPLLVLEARLELASRAGRRVLPLEAFITGVRETALRAGEIVSAVLIPPRPEAARSAFVKLGARRYLVISIAMVAALILPEGGRIGQARIAVGACAPVARRLPALEAALAGRPLSALSEPGLVSPEDLRPLRPIDDVRADAAYRKEGAAEAIRRALLAAAGPGGGHG